MTDNTATAGKNPTLVCLEMDTATGTSRRIPMLEDGLRVGGMNLEYTGNIWEICHTKGFDDAIQALRRPPLLPIGLDFPELKGGGRLYLLNTWFQIWEEGYTDAPDPNSVELEGLVAEEQLQPLVPTYALPEGGKQFWVSGEHLTLLLRYFVVNGIDVNALPPLTRWPFAPLDYLPARLPHAEGDVTPAHVAAFAAGSPNLASALMKVIPWTGAGARRRAPAKAANRAANDVLGIELDLRIGFLALAEQVDQTIVDVCDLADRSDDVDLVFERVNATFPQSRDDLRVPGGLHAQRGMVMRGKQGTEHQGGVAAWRDR